MINVLTIQANTEGQKGQIRIIDTISSYTESSAAETRRVVDELISKKIEVTDVYINSKGGSTVEAAEIVNELKRLPNVTIQVGAVAASAATYIMANFKNRGFTNSQFMIHPPKITLQGGIKEVKSGLQLIKNITEDYLSAYMKKMGKSKEEIEAIFEKGDYWMNAKQAKEMGLLDEIVDSDLEIQANDITILEACGAPNIPKIKPNTNTDMENRKQIIAKLKLPADATDSQIETAIAEAVQKADEVDNLKTAQTQSKQKQAKDLVEAAILDKRITADVKDQYEALALSDLDSTKAILEAMPKKDKPSNSFEPGKTNTDVRADWTMEDYQEKDPQALSKMMQDDPEKFKQLENDYFGTN